MVHTCVMEVVVIQGRSPNVDILFSYIIKDFSERKEFVPSGSQLFPLNEVPDLKLMRITVPYSNLPFDVHNYFRALAF